MRTGDWTPDQLELLATNLAERLLTDFGECDAEDCGECSLCQAIILLRVFGRPWHD